MRPLDHRPGILPGAAVTPVEPDRRLDPVPLDGAEGWLGFGGRSAARFVDQQVNAGIGQVLDHGGHRFVRHCDQREIGFEVTDQRIEIAGERQLVVPRRERRGEDRVVMGRRPPLPKRRIGIVQGHDLDAIRELLQAFHPAGDVIVLEPDNGQSVRLHADPLCDSAISH